MTSRNQLLTTAGVLACTLLITGVVEAHGGPYEVGMHLGTQGRTQIVTAASRSTGAADVWVTLRAFAQVSATTGSDLSPLVARLRV